MKTLAPIEPLEARIAPAVILPFTDNVDNDQVKVISDKPLTAIVTFAANGSPAELIFSGAGLDGANITFVVTKSPTGDGLVNIGRITATGLDLGSVTIPGDLGKIVCGNGSNPLPALKALKVRSMGLYGLSTQGAGDLVSTISGDLGSLTVTGDVLGARLIISGKAGAVKIGGDLRGSATGFSGRIQATSITSVFIGGDVVAGAGDESGKIAATGNLGKLTIRGSMYGALDGTGDPASGQIFVNGNAGPISIGLDVFGAVSEQKAIDVRGNAGAITIGGTIFAQGGLNSGSIFVVGNAGLVKIGRDLNGSSGEFSGAVMVGGSVGGFTLGGDLRGGSGNYQDVFTLLQVSFASSKGPVRVGGDIIGGTGRGSGDLGLGTGAPSFFLGGSLIGGGMELVNVLSFPGGSLSLGSVPLVTIVGDIRESAFGGGHLLGSAFGKLLVKGSLISANSFAMTTSGGPLLDISGLTTGRIEGSIVGSPAASGNDYTVRIGSSLQGLEIVGSLEGAAGSGGGSVAINGNAGSVKIGGSLRGGTGLDTGALTVNGRIGSLKIGGGVENGSASFTNAQVTATSYGTVLVVGDLVGGAPGGGEVRATTGGFDTITIGGSLYAGSAGGVIRAATTLGKVKIAGSVSGGFGMNQSSLVGMRAASITIGGDAFANGSGNNALINLRESSGPIVIGGDLRGSANEPAWLLFASDADVTKPGFASLTIKGRVSNALITGGFRLDMFGQNGDATLGPVNVRGDWTAASLVAGVNRGADLDFGTGDDTAMPTVTPALSRIAALTIGGQVLGTATAGDNYGVVAQSIGPVKIGGVNYTPGAVPIQLGAIFGDVTVRVI